MCGRFAQVEPLAAIIRTYFIEESRAAGSPRYNIAPGGPILTVIREGGKRVLAELLWGLIPPWVRDPGEARKLINARAETVGSKPSFRAAFRTRRCLVPATGFYEWKREGRARTPYFIRPVSGDSFALGGIYEIRESPEGPELRTCAIITTQANDLMAPIHDRMPAIIAPAHRDAWIDSATPLDDVLSLLDPYPPGEMEAYPVSTLVNSPSNDSPACIAPA
jgi:putative SOS response-associated peptidase YedK